jgi:methionyl-tRNA synthetase
VAKSSGNAISPIALVQKYGTDAVRYHLLRSIPLGKDGGFAEEELALTYNAFLANSYGNLASRLHALIRKNAAGVIPARGKTDPADQLLSALVPAALNRIESASADDSVQVLVAQVEDLIQATNLYLSDQEPWHLKEASQQKRVEEILGTAAYVFLAAARFAAALLPETTQKVEASFGVDLANSLKPADVAGVSILTITPLFPRL